MTTLRLILGDQLNPEHSWLKAAHPDVVYVLMEVRQETDYVLHHAQKIIGIFAAMRDLARKLKEAGHRVRYVRIDDAHNRQSITGNLDALIAHYGASSIEYQEPDEHRLDHQLSAWRDALNSAGQVSCRMVSSEHFLTERHELAQLFAGRKSWLMEHFYRHMRKKHRILMATATQPAGDQWNFDHDNRKPWKGQPELPSDWRSTHDHTELWQTIEAAGVKSLGAPQAQAFRWPLNRAEALQDLAAFVTHALPHFGDYQDARSTQGWRLFHSLLSFALNTKMLHPREVIDAAVRAYEQGLAPLAAVEGFVRQILGWREYVRGVYWAHMPGYEARNHLGHVRPLPEWFWTGQTHMACMAQAIGQSLEHAYAHHIQRLMVIGNFALLAGLSPQAVHQWYLGIYIDAFEWVELPNTLGMSQFADGGLLATKPYTASAAYLQRMGDECGTCRYKPKERLGEDACPFNALYWDFHLRHAPALAHSPRLAFVYKQIDRMDDRQRQAWLERGAILRSNLDHL
ncbi:MAG: cryptochrome/photolyase family protein [Burkholderiales bacterium]|nr:cryptochrome/photolyase family protein [Burkholderiales bacterium]